MGRFVARQLGLMGLSEVEAFQIDAITEMVRDIKDEYAGAKRGKEKGAELDAALKTWFDETLPAKVKLLEDMVPAGCGPFLVGSPAGSKVSLADITVYQFLAVHEGCFFDNLAGAQAACKDCPRISTAMTAVAAIPEVQEWIANRPKNM